MAIQATIWHWCKYAQAMGETYLSDWNSLNGSELKLKSVPPKSGLGNLRGADC